MRVPGFPLAALLLLLGSTAALPAEVREVGPIALQGLSLPAGDAARSSGEPEIAEALADALGLDDGASLQFAKEAALPNDRGRSLRFDQLFRGVPIWGQQAVFDIDAAPQPSPRFSAAAALQIGKGTVFSKRPGAFRNETAELVYRLSPAGELQLAYKVSFVTTIRDDSDRMEPTRPMIFVDAGTGAILHSYENIQHAAEGRGPGGNRKTGKYVFGKGVFPNFHITVKGSTCRMDSANVRTVNLHQKEKESDRPFAFPCFRNASDGINGGFSPANDSQMAGAVVFDLYKTWYQTRPIPQQLVAHVHFGEAYEGAFWDGEAMYFGGGADKYYPMVDLDVMGHEVSHGFTQENAALIYENQSGGINEAYSDMAGEAAEAFFVEKYGEPFAVPLQNFKVASHIIKPPAEARRFMCDPPRDGVSIDNLADYHDGMDVHHSSGIFNKAFCVLAKRQGWSVHKAFDLFVLANRSFWTPDTTFQRGAEDVLGAAEMLGYRLRDVAFAFKQVGIEVKPEKQGDGAVSVLELE
jgi:Zn-dependent metalloprotease